MSVPRWVKRAIVPRKRPDKAPDSAFGGFAIRPGAVVAVDEAGELHDGDGAAFAALVVDSPAGYVWYTHTADTDLLTCLLRSGITASLLARGCDLLPTVSGKVAAAVTVLLPPPDGADADDKPGRVTLQSFGIYAPNLPLHNDPADAATLYRRRAAELRDGAYRAFGTQLGLTPAQTSFRAWRQAIDGLGGDGQTEQKAHWQIAKRAGADVRTAYFGGYTMRAKRKPARMVRQYDLTSAYPWAMTQGVPLGAAVFSVDYRADVPGFWFVRASHRATRPPVLMVRNDDTGRMDTGSVTPRGHDPVWFTTWASSQEIELAREFGHAVEVERGWYWPRGLCRPFATFVGRAAEWRLSTSRGSVENQAVKLMQNSLYGRFGRRAEQEETIITAEPPDDPGWHPHFSVAAPVDCAWSRKASDPERAGTMPHWAAWITATVRCRLIRAVDTIGPGAVLYFDTDCIVTTGVLPTGDKYGDWRLVQTFSTFMVFGGKQYIGITETGELVVRAAGIAANTPAEVAAILTELHTRRGGHSPPEFALFLSPKMATDIAAEIG